MPVLFVFTLLLALVTQNVNTPLVYDGQTLLDLRNAVGVKINYGGPKPLPPLLCDILDHLCHVLLHPPQRKRYYHQTQRLAGEVQDLCGACFNDVLDDL